MRFAMERKHVIGFALLRPVVYYEDSLHPLQNGVTGVRGLVRGFVQGGAAVPGRLREAVGILVEIDFAGGVSLGEQYDLTRMHREVLDNVINRSEHSRLTTLNHD